MLNVQDQFRIYLLRWSRHATAHTAAIALLLLVLLLSAVVVVRLPSSLGRRLPHLEGTKLLEKCPARVEVNSFYSIQCYFLVVKHR